MSSDQTLFKSLLNAKKIDFYLDSHAEAVHELSQHLLDECRTHGLIRSQREEQRRLRHLRMLLLNLYAAYVADRRRYVSLPMERNYYSRSGRYQPVYSSHRFMTQIVTALHDDAVGYLQKHPGWWDEHSAKGYWTRIRGTQRLFDQFKKAELAAWMFSKTSDYEVIRLKDADKNLQDYKDDETTTQMRNSLLLINTGLSETFVGLHIQDDELEKICTASITKAVVPWAQDGEPDLLDWSDSWLYRVFNDSSFEKGGRFFGGWWQYIPSRLRKHVYVCHKGNVYPTHTVELDYSSVQPSLAYALHGLNPPEDSYRLHCYDPDTNQARRPLFKAALLRMFNTGSRIAAIESTIKALKDQDLPYDECEAEEAVDQLEAFHTPIRDCFFRKDIGKQLMFVESKVAERVMLDMLSQGAVVLPVHDSFLVAKGYRHWLENSMQRAFMAEVGKSCRIKADVTEPAYELHQKTGKSSVWTEDLDGIDDMERGKDRFWAEFNNWLNNQEWYQEREASRPEIWSDEEESLDTAD